MAPFLFLITWWLLWLMPAPRSFIYKYAWYTLLTLTLLISLSKTIDAYDEYWHPHIMIHRETSLYIGPSTAYGVSATLPAGSIVRLYQKKADWCKIKKQNLVGWIPAEKID